MPRSRARSGWRRKGCAGGGLRLERQFYLATLGNPQAVATIAGELATLAPVDLRQSERLQVAVALARLERTFRFSRTVAKIRGVLFKISIPGAEGSSINSRRQSGDRISRPNRRRTMPRSMTWPIFSIRMPRRTSHRQTGRSLSLVPSATTPPPRGRGSPRNSRSLSKRPPSPICHFAAASDLGIPLGRIGSRRHPEDRGRVKTRLQIAYDGRCFARGSDEAAGRRGVDQAAIALISGLTPKMLIMRFML